MSEKDCTIFHRDMLDIEFAETFLSEWLVDRPDGVVEQFHSDEDACAYQRTWRAEHGLDPMTGEEASGE